MAKTWMRRLLLCLVTVVPLVAAYDEKLCHKDITPVDDDTAGLSATALGRRDVSEVYQAISELLGSSNKRGLPGDFRLRLGSNKSVRIACEVLLFLDVGSSGSKILFFEGSKACPENTLTEVRHRFDNDMLELKPVDGKRMPSPWGALYGRKFVRGKQVMGQKAGKLSPPMGELSKGMVHAFVRGLVSIVRICIELGVSVNHFFALATAGERVAGKSLLGRVRDAVLEDMKNVQVVNEKTKTGHSLLTEKNTMFSVIPGVWEARLETGLLPEDDHSFQGILSCGGKSLQLSFPSEGRDRPNLPALKCGTEKSDQDFIARREELVCDVEKAGMPCMQGSVLAKLADSTPEYMFTSFLSGSSLGPHCFPHLEDKTEDAPDPKVPPCMRSSYQVLQEVHIAAGLDSMKQTFTNMFNGCVDAASEMSDHGLDELVAKHKLEIKHGQSKYDPKGRHPLKIEGEKEVFDALLFAYMCDCGWYYADDKNTHDEKRIAALKQCKRVRSRIMPEADPHPKMPAAAKCQVAMGDMILNDIQVVDIAKLLRGKTYKLMAVANFALVGTPSKKFTGNYSYDMPRPPSVEEPKHLLDTDFSFHQKLEGHAIVLQELFGWYFGALLLRAFANAVHVKVDIAPRSISDALANTAAPVFGSLWLHPNTQRGWASVVAKSMGYNGRSLENMLLPKETIEQAVDSDHEKIVPLSDPDSVYKVTLEK